VVIGTATDPYQPAERRFRITRGVLETLAEQQGLSVTIISKSPLVTRDLDLLVRIAARSRLSVHISLITADRDLRGGWSLVRRPLRRVCAPSRASERTASRWASM
jgi:DNA repair photolyase